MQSKYWLIIIISFAILIFCPAFNNFFGADDWYHLRLGQIQSVKEFINYFSFIENDQTAAFYRPLSTQVFFFLMQKLFGLWALPWYVFVSGMFGISVMLVYKCAKVVLIDMGLEKNEKKIEQFGLVSALIYGISGNWDGDWGVDGVY